MPTWSAYRLQCTVVVSKVPQVSLARCGTGGAGGKVADSRKVRNSETRIRVKVIRLYEAL